MPENQIPNINIKNEINKASKGNAFLIGSNRELKRLPLYLHQNEKVIDIISGSPGKMKGRGIVVATDERVIFIKDGWVFRVVQDFSYETISSVEFKTGFLFGVFVIYGKGDETSYNWVGRFAGAEFAKAVRGLIGNRRIVPAEHQRAILNTNGSGYVQANEQKPRVMADKLRELQQLNAEGLITEEDFKVRRDFLMESMFDLEKQHQEGSLSTEDFNRKKEVLLREN